MDDPFSLRTPVPVDPLPPALRIKHADQLVLIGSCFSDNIGSVLDEGAGIHTARHTNNQTISHRATPQFQPNRSRLQALKYTVDANPFGTSYNPVSLQRCLLRLLENRPFELGELGRHPRDGVYYRSVCVVKDPSADARSTPRLISKLTNTQTHKPKNN